MDSNPWKSNYVIRWYNPDFLKNGIVGIVYLDKDNILVLDRRTCSLILMDRRGQICTHYKFTSLPLGITQIDVNSVAVSIPGEGVIEIVALEFKDLVFKKQLKCSFEPCAIAAYENSLYIASNSWDGESAVYEMTNDGQINNKVHKDSLDKPVFKAPIDIVLDPILCDVFVCDAGLKEVLAFDKNLQIKYRIGLKDVGKHPSSLALNSEGDVFVCFKLENIIYKVATSTQKGKIAFTEKDGLARPQAMCFIPSEGVLCVLCAEDNQFKFLQTQSTESRATSILETAGESVSEIEEIDCNFTTIYCDNIPPVDFKFTSLKKNKWLTG